MSATGKPISDPRIIVVGRSFPIQLLEKVLLTLGANGYVCVDTLAATRFLTESASRRQILIVDASLFDSGAALLAFRREQAGHFVIAIPYCTKDFAAILEAELRRVLFERLESQALVPAPVRAQPRPAGRL